MGPVLRRIALSLFALLLPSMAAGSEGTTLYVNRVVVAPAGDLRLGDLVGVTGAVPAAAREVLARSVAVISDKLVYVPLSLYRAAMEEAFGRDAIIVGSRSIVIPKGTAAESEAYLFERLADWLLDQGMLGEGSVEITLTQNNAKGAPPRNGTPLFQVVRMVKGVAEVSFSLTSADGAVTGRAVLASAAGSAGVKPGVKSGAPVQVVFHKDLITIEMQGKALASAGIGETVSVFIADSQKRFTGRVCEGKVVEVDLP